MKSPLPLSALFAVYASLFFGAAAEPVATGEIAIIPQPASLVPTGEVFVADARTRLVYRTEAAAPATEALRQGLQRLAGFDLSAAAASADALPPGGIALEILPPAASSPSSEGARVPETPEGYWLAITPTGVTLQAATSAGLFYGVQTLLQLTESRVQTPGTSIALPTMRVADQPRHAWRGVLLDESRHFFGKPTVLALLDLMAELKLNRFQWHLTDEPGWRIEIKKYPRLTEIGSIGNWSDPAAPAAFYTQDEIREVVAYARERQITIVPEIDMPGHATAACRAYPELSGGGVPPRVGFTFNPAREQTYRFLENVLHEVVSLFPGPYLHLGGDEVHFGNQSWSTDPEIVEFTRTQGLKDAVELEHYFIRRMAGVVKSLGKTVLGWDEIADAGVPAAESIVVWWRHDKPQVLEQLLLRDYTVVLSPRIPCYFDFDQHPSHTHGRRWKEEFNELERVYAFPDASIEALIPSAKTARILGVEACLWSERIQNPDRLWFMTLPRLVAFAESAWTPGELKNHANFLKRLRPFLRGIEQRGLPSFNPFAPETTPEPPGPTRTADTPAQ